MEMPHWARIAGAEKEKVLMSPSSKKKQKPNSHIMWRWEGEDGQPIEARAAETRWVSCTFIRHPQRPACPKELSKEPSLNEDGGLTR